MDKYMKAEALMAQGEQRFGALWAASRLAAEQALAEQGVKPELNELPIVAAVLGVLDNLYAMAGETAGSETICAGCGHILRGHDRDCPHRENRGEL